MLNVAAVTEALPQSSAADEIEWTQLVASAAADRESHCPRDAEGREYLLPWESGVKFSNTPHPLSYGAKMPMRGLGLGTTKRTHKWTLTAAERKAITSPVYAAAKVVIRANAAHPDSYRADLPLRSSAVSLTLTAAEKATLAGRPIRYSLSTVEG